MQHYVGLDDSVKETSVCIVDKAGKVMREVKVATKPVAILAVWTRHTPLRFDISQQQVQGYVALMMDVPSFAARRSLIATFVKSLATATD